MSTVSQIRTDLRRFARKEKAAFLPKFFKTGKGQYGEGDQFLGVMVPDIRTVARRHADASEPTALSLLRSPWHEERLLALLILVHQFEHSDAQKRKRIARLYLSQTHRINNWDLVDLSAPNIIGAFVGSSWKPTLSKLAKSKNLWERRIAIISTFSHIRNGDCEPTLTIATMLLHDPHDLIHKACGWMLREVGKRCDVALLRRFLRTNAAGMPRTMLRYAIERLPEQERRQILRTTSADRPQLPSRPSRRS